jgi:hypothetical protein
VAGAGFKSDSGGAAEDRWEIDVDLRDSEAELRGSARQMGNASGGDGGFGGRAAEVDARSSEIFAFSERDLLPGFRKSARE